MPDDFVYSCGANRNVRVLKSNGKFKSCTEFRKCLTYQFLIAAVPSVYKAEFKQEEEDPFSMDEESGMSGPGPASVSLSALYMCSPFLTWLLIFQKTQICAVDGCTSHARQRAGITYHP